MYKLPVKLITLLFLVFFAARSTAQVQQYQFDRIGLKEGLLQENTHATRQDSKGFLWISSGAFLQRYDGQRFLNFHHKKGDKHSIPPGNINYTGIDKKNRLWIQTGTDNIQIILDFSTLATSLTILRESVYRPVMVAVGLTA
jgi:hypothetical protein